MFTLYMYSSWGLLALRAALGAVFVVHGPPKLKKSAQMAPHMGLSATTVWLVGLAETAGGFSVLLGFLTGLGALALIIVMAGALFFKIQKWHVPFTSMEKIGWEYDLILFCAALALLTTGPGLLSLDWLVLGKM